MGEKAIEIDKFSCKFSVFESEAQNDETSNKSSLSENSNLGIAESIAETDPFSCTSSWVETIRLDNIETEAENNSFGDWSGAVEMMAES